MRFGGLDVRLRAALGLEAHEQRLAGRCHRPIRVAGDLDDLDELAEALLGLRVGEAVASAGLPDPADLAVGTAALELDPAAVVAAVLDVDGSCAVSALRTSHALARQRLARLAPSGTGNCPRVVPRGSRGAMTLNEKGPALQALSRGERRDSNPRPPGPQPGALPTELRPPGGTEHSAVGGR